MNHSRSATGTPGDATNGPPAANSPEFAYEAADGERTALATPTEPVMEGGTLEAHDPYVALRYRDYRLFQLGWMTSVLGYQVTAAAIAWEVYDRTQSKLQLGWVAGIQVIPLILLALPAGAMADRLDRRRIVSVTSLIAAACAVGLAMLSYRAGSIPWMFALLGAMSTAQVLGRPARSALMPTVVPPRAFSNAVTWNASFFQIASMTGALVGGLTLLISLPRFGSAALAYGLDACCGVVFATTMFLLGPPIASAGTRRAREPILQSFSAGVRFVWQRQIILATMTLDLFAVLLGGAVYLLPVFVKDVLHVPARGHGEFYYGLLRLADAFGAISMSILIAHLPPMKKAGRSMLLAVAGFGAATIVFGLSRTFWLSFAALFLTGAFDAVSVVVRHTLVQVLTPDSMRGRVSAVNNIFIGASNELGGVESGLTAYAFGPVASVVGGGIGTLLVVCAVAAAWPKLRKYGSLNQPPPVE